MPEFIRIESAGVSQTMTIAGVFSSILRTGDTVGLYGELGAGKTVFVRGICAGIGYQGIVTSPTFALLHSYPSSPPLFHIDCFRMRKPQEIVTTGFDELISLRSGIILVEWAEIINTYFDKWDYRLSLNFSTLDDSHRVIRIMSRNAENVSTLAELLK
jgi:tRNA threonylcarbamoyladenosine biosynthesis protein TsaE